MDYYLKCFYCEHAITFPFDRKKGVRKGTKDHIIPLIKGGTNRGTNLVPCCNICNGSKGGMMLKDWLVVLREKGSEWEKALDNATILYNAGSVATIPYSISLMKRKRVESITYNGKPISYFMQKESKPIREDRAMGKIEAADDYLKRREREYLERQTPEQFELAKKHGWHIAQMLTAPAENFHIDE